MYSVVTDEEEEGEEAEEEKKEKEETGRTLRKKQNLNQGVSKKQRSDDPI